MNLEKKNREIGKSYSTERPKGMIQVSFQRAWPGTNTSKDSPKAVRQTSSDRTGQPRGGTSRKESKYLSRKQTIESKTGHGVIEKLRRIGGADEQ